MIRFLDEEWSKHGDVFRVELGTRPTIVVAHPDALERVLGSHRDRYTKGSSYDSLRAILGEGLVTATGLAWRKQRAVIQPSFHRAGLQELVTSMGESTLRYFDDLERRFPHGGVLDIHREMVKLTLDIVVSALFGRGLVEAADVRYEVLSQTLEVVSERSNSLKLPLSIPTPGNLRFKRVLAELDAIIYQLITRARAQRAERGPVPSSTMLDMLLDAVDAETGLPLSEKLVRDELVTMFVAGHETTALALTWLFPLLDKREDVWAQLRNEAEDVLSGRPIATSADLPKLKYTRAVVDEGLRLRGPAPMIARDVIADDNLLGFKVNRGDRVLTYFYGVHRHPRFWQRPFDFDPERFMPEQSAARDRWSYVPFSSGQRVCIGNMFSLHESVIILSKIATLATPRLISGQRIEPVMMGTVRPSKPVFVNWRWR